MSRAPFDPREFIARAPWTLSKTTEHLPDWKHWYIVEAKFSGADLREFRRFVKLIADEGYDASFERIRYRYLRVDEFIYWTSRSAHWNPGVNVNRRPWADVEGRPEHEQTTLPV
jgi:hypothetical protein